MYSHPNSEAGQEAFIGQEELNLLVKKNLVKTQVVSRARFKKRPVFKKVVQEGVQEAACVKKPVSRARRRKVS